MGANWLKKLNSKLNQGIFKNYYIGQMIECRKDNQAFMVYYQDKIMAVSLASLLDLDFEAVGNEFKVISPATGKSAILSFYFAPPFSAEADNEIKFTDDVQNLVAFEKFIMGEIKAKFPEAPEFDSFFEAHSYATNFIVKSSDTDDQFKKQRLDELFACAKDRLFFARPETTCMDQDIVMSSAWHNINFLSGISKAPAFVVRNFSNSRQIEEINNNLRLQFTQPIEERNIERVTAHNINPTERRTNKSRFWEYKKMCDNFKKTPEMW